MLTKILALVTLLSAVVLSAILQTTSPSTIHPMGILAVLVMFYLSTVGTLTFFMLWVYRLAARRTAIGRSVQVTQLYYYASVLALAPILLVGLRSIGRGSIWDIILIVAFETVAIIYITKRR